MRFIMEVAARGLPGGIKGVPSPPPLTQPVAADALTPPLRHATVLRPPLRYVTVLRPLPRLHRSDPVLAPTMTLYWRVLLLALHLLAGAASASAPPAAQQAQGDEAGAVGPQEAPIQKRSLEAGSKEVTLFLFLAEEMSSLRSRLRAYARPIC